MPRPRILVVDDEKLIRWTLRERLEGAGYAVTEAETGTEALAKFDEARTSSSSISSSPTSTASRCSGGCASGTPKRSSP